MPLPEDGWLHGFQLWLNLPANEKMRAPQYLDSRTDRHPMHETDQGVRVRVLAGPLTLDGVAYDVELPQRTTQPRYADVELPQDGELQIALPEAPVMSWRALPPGARRVGLVFLLMVCGWLARPWIQAALSAQDGLAASALSDTTVALGAALALLLLPAGRNGEAL